MADDTKDTANDEKLEEAFEQLEGQAEAVTPPSDQSAKKAAKNSGKKASAQVGEDKPKSGGGLGSGLAIFLAIIAMGIAAYPAYEIYRISQASPGQNPLASEVQSLRSELATELSSQQRSTARQIQELTQRLDELATSKQTEAGQQAELKQFVEREVSSIRARMGASAQDWVYAEVEYLIRMADQRVLMEGDAGAARKMLEAADKIIRQSEGLTAHGLRQALAKDIVALRGVATPDTQGIYLELSALAGQVKNLHQDMPKFEPLIAALPIAAEQPTLTTKMLAVMNNAGARLASLVDFRRDGIEVQPILPPREVYYLRQNLVLKIQLAQLALLDGNEATYGQALTEAAAWVANSFGDQDATAASMQNALLRLSREKIAVVLPDISGSLREARRHLAAVHHREAGEPFEMSDTTIEAKTSDKRLSVAQNAEKKSEDSGDSSDDAESTTEGSLVELEAAADTNILETQQE